MEFGQAFTYVFKDPDWLKKVALTGLIGLIPIVGLFYILGWALEMARRVINNEPEVLPEINFGAFMGKGFQAFIIALIYSIPAIIFSLPSQLVGPIAVALQLDSNTLNIVITVVSVCCGGLTLIYNILLGFMLPAALGNFAAKGQLGAGLRFGEVFGLVKAAPVAYLLVLVGEIIVGIISPLGAIACIIGIIVTEAYGLAVMGHFIGQAYKVASAKTAI
jgi:hypothetical protein